MELLDRLFERWRQDPARVVLVIHAALPGAHGGAPDVESRHEVSAAALLEAVAVQAVRVLELRAGGARAVGLWANNGLELVAALIAAIDGGIAVAPLPLDLPADEVRLRARLFGLDAVWSGSACSQEEHFAPDPARRAELPADAALLLSTSGTTGEPRAVVIGREGLSRHTLGLADEVMGLGEGDRVLAALPLAHSFGCRMALFVPLASGATVHLVPRFSARTTLNLIAAERLTFAPVVPTMLSAWCALPRLEPSPGSLRWVLSAGAPLPEGLRVRAEAHLGCDVREGYGLTEASFCTLDRPDGLRVGGTVGRPTPGVDVRLSESGEVEVRGPNMMLGYLGDPAGSAAVLTDDGYLKTGDLGALRGDRLSIVDRKKDIVLTGGFTVYPAEVERVLSQVAGVAGCAVFGLPDPHLGERVAVAVVWSEGNGRSGSRSAADEAGEPPEDGSKAYRLALLEGEATRHLARHAVPSRWFFVAELPIGPSGKVQKRKLRETLGAQTAEPLPKRG